MSSGRNTDTLWARWARRPAWLALMLLILHWTITDRFAGLAVIYLLTPFPFIGLLLLPYTLHHWFAGYKRSAIMLTLAACAIPAWHFVGPWLSGKSPPADLSGAEFIKVVFWTSDNFEFTTVDDAFEYLVMFDADIIALVEGNVDHGRQKARAAEFFPNYRMELLPHGMLLLHRGQMEAHTAHLLDDGSGALNLCWMRINGREITLAIYDQVSNPLRNRTPALRELRDLLVQIEGSELVAMGDFNVPRTAFSVRQLGDVLQPAFSTFKNRNPYTWPEVFPFLAIDQIWFSERLSIQNARVVDTGLANHRLLRFQVHFRDRAPLPAQ